MHAEAASPDDASERYRRWFEQDADFIVTARTPRSTTPSIQPCSASIVTMVAPLQRLKESALSLSLWTEFQPGPKACSRWSDVLAVETP
jgi:hypothetical protein